MTIQRDKDEIVIRISGNVDIESIQQFINLLRYKEITSTKKAVSQAEVDKISTEINMDWWKQNKGRLLKSMKNGLDKILNTQNLADSLNKK